MNENDQKCLKAIMKQLQQQNELLLQIQQQLQQQNSFLFNCSINLKTN